MSDTFTQKFRPSPTFISLKHRTQIHDAALNLLKYMMASSKPAVTSVVYGDPSKFVTRAQILRFRTITTLLELTNFVDEPLPSKMDPGDTQLNHTHTTRVLVSTRMKMRIYRKLTAALVILCREDEIVVVTLDPKNTVRCVRTGGFEEQSETGASHEPHCRATQSLDPTLDPVIKSLRLLFLQTTTGLDHGNVFLRLLEETYTVKDDVTIATSDCILAIYVHLNCGTKIFKRIEAGTTKPYFFSGSSNSPSSEIIDKLF